MNGCHPLAECKPKQKPKHFGQNAIAIRRIKTPFVQIVRKVMKPYNLFCKWKDVKEPEKKFDNELSIRVQC
jgi:hypothetical protein